MKTNVLCHRYVYLGIRERRKRKETHMQHCHKHSIKPLQGVEPLEKIHHSLTYAILRSASITFSGAEHEYWIT